MDTCRVCLTKAPYLFLPMGDHPPANMFVRPDEVDEVQPSYPLNTFVCLQCGLIQVADQIPEDFFRHYLYVPSGAATMHTHFGALATILGAEAGSKLIVDIGCNDGLLLSICNKQGSKTLGIDPAANLAEIANGRGVDVHVAYFNTDTAREVRDRHGRAKVIVTTNTFNHIGDLHKFMAGVLELLSDDGVFIIEVPRAMDLIELNEFDTVYHEHVSEFSVLSIARLGEYFGLEITDIHRLTVHGGSMRVLLRRTTGAAAPIVQQMLDEERNAGMCEKATYDAFSARVETIRHDLLAMLKDLKAQGLRIVGYGAPAKGNTLLNYFQIGPDQLDFLVDRNPLKQGLYSPGMKIPIRSPDAIATEKPDILLVLAWNFFDEIREQNAEFREAGGCFLVPLPTPRLID